ncbi:hypothetical protein F5B22DRAFT_453168 [Xylaria bambusicola]|uniref:uncharacterized protein n=1 Tax=Xylaria bambusicola TaxID=326684 RepID=UPI0020085D2A|nr:uncharacterized protein F5B22DRAFT_453168 [Xylaria bambusicola]KAI0506398.1 hypothetical protein F5B22DRAFT_453168 [Xylaria bambusicola]
MAVSLVVESAIWFGITILVVIARIVCRKILLGSFKKFQTDDILMLIAVVTDTIFLVTMNILHTTNTNLIDPQNPPILTPQEIDSRVYGSKLVLVVEQMQIATTWLVKGCLLIMYSRLTGFNKIQAMGVKIVAAYTVLSFVVMEILYLGVWCRPFTEYWAVPPKSTQCSAATNHLITNAVLNISSDLFILIIPLPIFAQINIAFRKKVVLCGVFALGSFTIGAAIANKYYSFTSPFASTWAYWYIRESSTALIVSNIPFLWTSVRFALRLTSSRGATSGKTDGAGGLSYGHNAKSVNHNTIISRGPRGGGGDDVNDFSPLGSQEDVKYYNDSVPLKIYKHSEIHVTTETNDAASIHSRPSKDHVYFDI